MANFNAGAIRDGIVSVASSAGTLIKEGAVWAGRKISDGFNNYLVPAITRLWQLTVTASPLILKFFRTCYGLGTLSMISAASLFAYAKGKDGAFNTALKISAVVCAGVGVTSFVVGFVTGNPLLV